MRASVRASRHSPAELSKRLEQKGIRVSPGAEHELRFVTHRHIGEADIDKALGAFAEVWQSK